MSSTVPTVRNVTRIFRQATAEELAAGREWYGRASRLAAELAVTLPTAHAYYGDVSRAAAVIAVLSPQTSWPINVRLARQAYGMAFVHTPTAELADALPTMGRSASKAARLLTTTDPTDQIVSGPKVTAFWRTIANPLDPFAVVVDRHAVDIAVGRVTDDATRGRLLAGKRYEQVCDVYRRAAVILARECGPLSPAIVQATTWVTWRSTRALANHGDISDVTSSGDAS